MPPMAGRDKVSRAAHRDSGSLAIADQEKFIQLNAAKPVEYHRAPANIVRRAPSCP